MAENKTYIHINDNEEEIELDISNLDVDAVISWVSDHEWLYSDFCQAFGYKYNVNTGKEKNKPDLEDIIEWLDEHGGTVWEDFTHHFKLVEDDDYY